MPFNLWFYSKHSKPLWGSHFPILFKILLVHFDRFLFRLVKCTNQILLDFSTVPGYSFGLHILLNCSLLFHRPVYFPKMAACLLWRLRRHNSSLVRYQMVHNSSYKSILHLFYVWSCGLLWSSTRLYEPKHELWSHVRYSAHSCGVWCWNLWGFLNQITWKVFHNFSIYAVLFLKGWIRPSVLQMLPVLWIRCMFLRRLRSFQRGTVSLCSLMGCKVLSYQS